MAFSRIVFATMILAGFSSLALARQGQPSLTGLGRALAAEQRCSTLGAADKADLEKITEERRVAEAARAPAVAKELYDTGMAIGAKAKCDAMTASAIKAVLVAARTAPPLTIEALPADTEAEAPAKPIAQERNAEAPKVAAPVKRKDQAPKPAPQKPTAKATAAQTQSLAAYGTMVESYYRELRCQRMSSRQVNAFYQNVLAAHRKAALAYGTRAAATAVRRAEGRARGGSC